MLVENQSITKQPEAQLNSSDPNGAPGLGELPPSFEQATEDRLLPDPPQQDPPPPFSTYKPTFFTNEDGAVISHDPHLNQSGEALYRFLLAQSSTPPTYHLHLSGSHNETRTRVVNDHRHHGGSELRRRRHERNDTEIKTETKTEVIVDFDFRIDLTPNITRDPAHSPVQWSVPDDDPAYRGEVHRQVETPAAQGGETVMRTPGTSECEEYESWCTERDSNGQPPWAEFASRRNPWAPRDPPPEGETQFRSSRTVRQWCDDYCASEKLLKEFIYTKHVYGWDFRALKRAIETTVKQTSYTGTLEVKFTPFPSANNLIIVRPANTLSKFFFDPELKVVLWITLIYPFIWLFRQFYSRGGGTWKTCGGGYPLKVVLPLPGNPGDLLGPPDEASGSSSPAYAREMTYVIGEREGEWFKKWENTIRCAVSSKTQDKVPLVYPSDGPYVNPSAALLDGYRD